MRSDIGDMSSAVSDLLKEAAHGNTVWGSSTSLHLVGSDPQSVHGRKAMSETSLAVEKETS